MFFFLLQGHLSICKTFSLRSGIMGWNTMWFEIMLNSFFCLFVFYITPSKNNKALRKSWYIGIFLTSFTVNPQRKTHKKEEIRSELFFFLLACYTDVSVSEVFISYKKAFIFWHSVNIIISMFRIFFLSWYLKGKRTVMPKELNYINLSSRNWIPFSLVCILNLHHTFEFELMSGC